MQIVNAVFYNLPALATVLGGIVLLALALGLSHARGKKCLWVLLFVALALHLVVFLGATIRYVNYPYEGKSVVEGVLLYNSIGYMHGQTPYHAPDALPATSLNYPPVYDMALAAFFWLVGGPSLYAGRLFSLLAAIGTAIIAGIAVWRRTRNIPASLFGGMLVITLYGITGHWIEQVRNDSLMNFLAVLGCVLAARSMARGRFPLGALIALLLATFTKQVALYAVAAVVIYLWLKSPRQALAWGGSFILATVAIFIGMEIWTHGWFSFYVLKLPLAVGSDWTKYDLASTFFGGGTFILLWGILAARIAARVGPSAALPDMRFGMLLLGLGLAACIAQSFKWGAALNAFTPIVPIAAVLGGLAFHELLQRSRDSRWLQATVLALALAQVAMISYEPILPTERDYRAQERIAQWVRAAPGDVFVSVFSSQVYLNGKRYFGDDVQLGDLYRAGYWRGGELLSKVRGREFSLLILRVPLEPKELAEAVQQNYVEAEFLPMRSKMCRWNMEVYVPKDAPWRPAPDNAND